MGSDPAVRTHGLTKHYGDVVALEDLDLEVAAGEVLGYLGPNGAGKTTTIRLLLGLHRPTRGDALIFGIDAWREPQRAHRHIAYVPGDPSLWPSLTGEETLHFLARIRGGADAAYQRELVDRFELDVTKKVRALSKGNRQKVHLVAALSTRADLLVLDEPTSGLDPLMSLAFRECVREARGRGQAVFLSSHILSDVEEVCDRVAILRDGRLIDQGSLRELRHLRAQTLEVTFADAPPPLTIPGIASEPVGPRTLRFDVRDGDAGAVLTALAGLAVVSLTSHEPSLEEIFLHHYGTARESP